MKEAFGIYVHWPFCAAKCPYCDFNSHVRFKPIDQQRFAKAFIREMAYYKDKTGDKEVSSIFIGGGTPSLMEPKTVETILTAIHDFWPIQHNAEITMEANPSSVEADRFKAYKAAGVNRLSLGVQALDDMELKRLGRLHDVKQALYAIDLAREIFPRLSFDLIYARPNQTLEAWQKELNQAIDLAADHLSLYQLTIEEGTAFQKLYDAGRLIMPEDEVAAELYALTQNITSARGLPAYEISNHAKSGAESQHNLLYWRYGEYLGLGAGAHGRYKINNVAHGRYKINNVAHGSYKVDNAAHGRYKVDNVAHGSDEINNAAHESRENIETTKCRRVTINEKSPEKWLELVESQGHGIVEEEYLNIHQQADEMLLMGLRLYEGLDLARFEALGAYTFDPAIIQDLQQQGLIEMANNQNLRATSKGRIVLNHIIEKLAQ